MFKAMEEIENEGHSSPVSDDNGSGDNTDLLPAPFDCDGIPVNWCKFKDSQPRMQVQLKPDQLEYEKISAEFSRANIKVTKIVRLQNMVHLDRFKTEMEKMKKSHSQDLNPDIRYLYHGTCIKTSKGELKLRLSRMDHLREGFYFSDSPIKCLHYSDFVNHPERAVILKCRVLDCKGFPEDLSEYVVDEERRVMIEYIISFAVEMKKREVRKKSSENAWKYVAVGLGVGAVGFVATPLIAVAALGAVGFTSGGVAAGSIAAAIHASIGNVAAGSAFALAQSAGATGVVSLGTQLAGGTVFGTAGAAVMKLFKRKPTGAEQATRRKNFDSS